MWFIIMIRQVTHIILGIAEFMLVGVLAAGALSWHWS